VPAPAVIPAPIAYSKIVAIKTLVVCPSVKYDFDNITWLSFGRIFP